MPSDERVCDWQVDDLEQFLFGKVLTRTYIPFDVEGIERVVGNEPTMECSRHDAFQLLAGKPDGAPSVMSPDAEPLGEIANEGRSKVSKCYVSDLHLLSYEVGNNVAYLFLPDVGALGTVNANSLL